MQGMSFRASKLVKKNLSGSALSLKENVTLGGTNFAADTAH
jgi:hypothetical protein